MDKGESGVIVLEIDRLTHTLRILVDKAENALVFTALLFVHKRSLKLKSDILVFILFNNGGISFSVALKKQLYLALCKIKSVSSTSLISLEFIERSLSPDIILHLSAREPHSTLKTVTTGLPPSIYLRVYSAVPSKDGRYRRICRGLFALHSACAFFPDHF